MDLGFDVVVTITGIVLVFLILVLLMAIITLEGKIFDSMNAKKKAAKSTQSKGKVSTNENGRVGDRPYARGRAFSDHYGDNAQNDGKK